PGGGLSVPPHGHGLAQVAELTRVGELGRTGDLGGGPAEPVVMLDGQTEFFSVGLEVPVVVAPLPGGVLNAALVGQGVSSFVQEGAENLVRGAAQPFAADHDLGVLLAGDVPPAGSVVAQPGLFSFGAAGDDDDGRRDFRVPAADLQPDIFQHLQQAAG